VIFFIYNTFWQCFDCNTPDLCGVIDAPENDEHKIREISELVGEKLEKIHDTHEKNWNSYRNKNPDSDYNKFLKIYPTPRDSIIIKEEFEKFGFKLVAPYENEIRIGKY
jgi:hypothetical protein